MKWTVIVNPGENSWDGTGALDFTGKSVSVVDTLSDNMIFLPDTLQAVYTTGYQQEMTGVSSVTQNGNELTINLKPFTDHLVTITYYTQVKDTALQQSDSVSLETVSYTHLDVYKRQPLLYLDEARIQEDAKFDGYFMVVTSEQSMAPATVMQQYHEMCIRDRCLAGRYTPSPYLCCRPHSVVPNTGNG